MMRSADRSAESAPIAEGDGQSVARGLLRALPFVAGLFALPLALREGVDTARGILALVVVLVGWGFAWWDERRRNMQRRATLANQPSNDR